MTDVDSAVNPEFFNSLQRTNLVESLLQLWWKFTSAVILVGKSIHYRLWKRLKIHLQLWVRLLSNVLPPFLGNFTVLWFGLSMNTPHQHEIRNRQVYSCELKYSAVLWEECLLFFLFHSQKDLSVVKTHVTWTSFATPAYLVAACKTVEKNSFFRHVTRSRGYFFKILITVLIIMGFNMSAATFARKSSHIGSQGLEPQIRENLICDWNCLLCLWGWVWYGIELLKGNYFKASKVFFVLVFFFFCSYTRCVLSFVLNCSLSSCNSLLFIWAPSEKKNTVHGRLQHVECWLMYELSHYKNLKIQKIIIIKNQLCSVIR